MHRDHALNIASKTLFAAVIATLIACGGAGGGSNNENRLAFMTDRDGNSEIYLMDPSGLNPLRLTTNAADDTYPSWKR